MSEIDFIEGLYPLSVTIKEDMEEVRLMFDNRRYIIVMSKLVYSILKLHDYKSVINAVIDEMIKAYESGIIKSGPHDVFGKFKITQSHFTTTGMISRLSYFTKPFAERINSRFNYIHVGLREGIQYTKAEKLMYVRRVIKYKKNKDNRRYMLSITTDTKIDWEYCFAQSTAIQCYTVFSQMQMNFYWSDIELLICTHLVLGQAYCNAVRRVSKYSFDEDGNKLCSAYKDPTIPPSYVVFEEFTKILKKYYFEGNEIDFAIFECYVKDHLSNNHPI